MAPSAESLSTQVLWSKEMVHHYVGYHGYGRKTMETSKAHKWGNNGNGNFKIVAFTCKLYIPINYKCKFEQDMSFGSRVFVDRMPCTGTVCNYFVYMLRAS